jgi:hypothetical protein
VVSQKKNGHFLLGPFFSRREGIVMARATGGSLSGAHWWQRHPMFALFVGWVVIGSLGLAVAVQLWPILARFTLAA